MPDPRSNSTPASWSRTCLDVQPGWQVIVAGGVLGRPLLEEVARQRRAARRLRALRPGFGGNFVGAIAWAREAPMELIENASPIEVDTCSAGRRAHRDRGAGEHAQPDGADAGAARTR